MLEICLFSYWLRFLTRGFEIARKWLFSQIFFVVTKSFETKIWIIFYFIFLQTPDTYWFNEQELVRNPFWYDIWYYDFSRDFFQYTRFSTDVPSSSSLSSSVNRKLHELESSSSQTKYYQVKSSYAKIRLDSTHLHLPLAKTNGNIIKQSIGPLVVYFTSHLLCGES